MLYVSYTLYNGIIHGMKEPFNFKNEKIEVVTKNGLSPYIGPKILNEVQYV